MKKIKYLAVVLPLIMTGLTGCGPAKKPSSSSSSASESSSQPASSSSSSSGEKITSVKVKFWHTFGQTIVDGLNAKIQTFHDLVLANDGVDVEVELSYQGGYDDIATKISNGFSVGNKPTIAVAYPDNVADYIEVGKSVNQEFVVNLDKFINDKSVGFGKESWLGDKNGANDFIDEFYSEGSRYAVEGTYSLPYMKSTEIMFYNIPLLQKAMKTYEPTADIWNSVEQVKNYMSDISWDDFIDLCTHIKTNMAAISKGLEVPFCYDSDGNYFITKMFQNEIGFSSVNKETGRGSILFGEGENLEATKALLERANDYYNAGIITTKGIRGTYGSDFFTGESCVFSIGSSGGSGYNFPKADAFDLGICRVPYENDQPIYVSQGPTLALFSDDGLGEAVNEATQLYAWKFMKYITNGDINAELCIQGSEGYIPVRYSAYETTFFREFMEQTGNYQKCFEVVIADVLNGGGFLVTDAFKGSAKLRDYCESLVTKCFTAKDKANIPTYIQECISEANKYL